MGPHPGDGDGRDGNINFKRNVTKLHVPSFESMLLPKEEWVISNNINLFFETLNKLKENINAQHNCTKFSKTINCGNVDTAFLLRRAVAIGYYS